MSKDIQDIELWSIQDGLCNKPYTDQVKDRDSGTTKQHCYSVVGSGNDSDFVADIIVAANNQGVENAVLMAVAPKLLKVVRYAEYSQDGVLKQMASEVLLSLWKDINVLQTQLSN